MKKSLIISFLFWFIAEFVFLIIFSFSGSVIAAALFLSLLIISLASYITCIFSGKCFSATIKFPATAKKSKDTEGTLIINNASHFHFIKVFCCISAKNCMTGEREEKFVPVFSSAETEASADFICRFSNCGYTEIRTEKMYLTDFFGFIPYKIRGFTSSEAKCTVLPDTFDMTVIFDNIPAAIDDSESYSPDKKGNDCSETFQLREYIPGDSIKQIHWKLSEKLDKVIVREASLPVQKSTLVFWDKYSENGLSPRESDSMAEVTASICRALTKAGTPFSLGWNENKNCFTENISSTEELIRAIPRILKGSSENDISGAKRYFESFGSANFSKIIYISKSIPDGYDDFSAKSSITPVLCSSVPVAGAITFDTDSYKESLNILELAI